MKRRIAALFLALALSLSPASHAFSANFNPTAESKAQYLYDKGLFKGMGVDENGKPIFALDRQATRGEGITMFVRLLGKEAEATTNTYTTPFTDVPAWANGYVGYAYTNGLTKGTGAATFAPDNKITAYEFITLCLRALGYKDGVDFTWDAPRDAAEMAGIVEGYGWEDQTQPLTRGDMVTLAYNTLFAQKSTGNGVTARVREIDAGDADNLLPANDGKYYLPIDSLDEGTLITRDDFVYTPGAGDANKDNFINVLMEMNPNVTISNKNDIYIGSYKTMNLSTKGGNWVIKNLAWIASTQCRNMTLTAMAYFGNKDMAKAVYGMVDEFYRFCSDKTVPITTELAAKYGLTISNDNQGTGGSVTATVSNGSSTWTIVYVLQNEGNTLGSTSFRAFIPIDEVSTLGLAA